MAKEGSLVLRVCNFITKYSIYATIFLIPIFFLPWTADILDFNKQAILVLLGFIALFAWMLKTLVLGKLEINFSKIHIVVGSFFVVYFLATVFSVNRYGSFWGWPQSIAESLLSLIGFLIFYFLVSNTFSKKNISTGVIVLSISALIAQIIGILQLSGLFIIPFSFSKIVSFNTIGSVGSFGLFTAVLLPLTIIMLILSKKWWKILFAVELVLSVVILFLINYSIMWWVVLIGSAVVMAFGILKRNILDGRWMALPMFFLAVSIFFVALNPNISFMPQRFNEISLSQKASFDVSLQAIKERPIFGSGLGTFSYNFSKFKNPDFSKSSLWNVTFSQATSKVLNDLASTGILGISALLALIALPIFYGVKFLLSDKSSDVSLAVVTGVLAVLIAEGLMYFIYNSNVVLSFISFFMMAILVVLTTPVKKQYELKSSSLMTLIVTFAFTLIFIFGLGILVLNGQRYIAEVDYYKGLSSWQAGDKVVAVRKLELAASLNSSSDLYFKQLSRAYLYLLQDELQNIKETPSDEQKNKVQALIANSVNAGKIATNLNPRSSNNWSNLGFIYQSLYNFMTDSTQWAQNSYVEALKLDPNSPYLLFQKGTVEFILASNLGSDQADQKSKLLEDAKNDLEKAINLRPNYSDGLYSLGLVYDALGQKDKAIAEFIKVQQLNPEETTIPKILSNLKAGLPALQAPPAVTPPEDDSAL